MRNHFGDLGLGHAVVEGALEVALELLGAVGGGEDGDGDQAAIALGEFGAFPDVAEQDVFGDLYHLGHGVADAVAGGGGWGLGHGVSSRLLVWGDWTPCRGGMSNVEACSSRAGKIAVMSDGRRDVRQAIALARARGEFSVLVTARQARR